MRAPLATALLAPLLLLGCDSGGAPDHAAVESVWVRLPAIPGRPGAAYFTLIGGKAADRLTSLDSAAVDRVELHTSMAEGSMTGMRPLGEVAIAPGQRIAFAPGGNHAMLFGIDPAIRPGRPLTLFFRFGSGRGLPVEAEVRAAGDAPPETG